MNPIHAAAPKILALCLLLPLGACASADQQTAGAMPAEQADSGARAPAAEERLVEAEIAWQGRVLAVDAAERLVTVREADGRQRTFRIDPEVGRLDRVQPGDMVEVFYRRSLVFDMQPAGSAEPGAYIWEDEQHPDPERPGVIDREVVVVLSPLVAVDTEASTISVSGPRGGVHVLDVDEPRHREALPRLRVGDMLRIQFRRVLAVRVVPEA